MSFTLPSFQHQQNYFKCTQNASLETTCGLNSTLTLECRGRNAKFYDYYCELDYFSKELKYFCTGCNLNYTKEILVSFFSETVKDFIVRGPMFDCGLNNKTGDVVWTCNNSSDFTETLWDKAHYDWSFLFVVVFIIAGGVGNILVCLAVLLDRRLQNVTNYFLLSLAIADLLVSLFVMPLGAIPGFLDDHLSETLDVNTVPVPGESDSILSILGDDQNEQNMFSDPIQPEIASRWAKVLKNGLPQDTKQDLIKKYLPPQNCCEVNPPKMNPEVKTAVAENTIRRDIRLAQLQEQVGAAISAIGYTLTSMLQEKEGANKKYIEVLNNAGRLLSDVHYCESVSRRELLGINLNKDLKDTLKNTQISDLLFGSDLDNTIRTAKDLEKSSEQLKAQKKSAQPSNHSITSKQGNFRRPFPQKTGVQRTGQIFRAPTNQRRPYVNQRYQQKRQDRHQPRNDRKRHQY